MYLLDSCAVSDFMRGNVNTSSRIKSLSPSIIFISSITQMEISYGLLKKFEKSHIFFKILKEFLSEISILPFDNIAAKESAIIRTNLEKKGTPIGAYDIFIAGIAKSQNLILVTSNEREFKRVSDLAVENWRAGSEESSC